MPALGLNAHFDGKQILLDEPSDPKRNTLVGTSLDDFLKEEGIYEEVEAAAVMKVAAISKRISITVKNDESAAKAE